MLAADHRFTIVFFVWFCGESALGRTMPKAVAPEDQDSESPSEAEEVLESSTDEDMPTLQVPGGASSEQPKPRQSRSEKKCRKALETLVP